MGYKMGDWSIVSDNSNDQKKQYVQPKSDWSVVPVKNESKPSQPQEGFGTSLAMAAPRIGEDLLKGGVNFAKKIPEYYQSAKSGIGSIINSENTNPANELKQLGAGLAEQGYNIYNTPHDLINYLTNRLNLIPQGFNQKVQEYRMPEDTLEMIDRTFGKPKTPGEEAWRSGARNSLNILGAGKTASVLNPLNLTHGNIAKDIVKTGERNKKTFGNHYENLWKEAHKKGLADLKHIVPDIDIKTLKKYSPEKAITRLDDFVKNPTVQTAHNAKSDLLHIKRELEKKVTLQGAEKKQYKAVNNAINDIKNNMFKKKSGEVDRSLMNKYNKIQKGYSNKVVPYKNKAINEYKRNEKSATELVNALSHGAFNAKRGWSHPSMKLRNALGPLAAGAGLGGAGLYLYNDLIGNKVPEQ